MAGKDSRRVRQKALLIAGSGGILKTDIIQRAKKILENEGVEVFELPNITPNPLLEDCEKGAELCRKYGIEVIVSVGGGSVNDAAKVICFAALETGYGHLREYFLGERVIKAALPLITVMTAAGTGSEISSVDVLKDKERNQKLGMRDDKLFPRAAILDPEFT
jgi:alcohol dehydrogenase YqhD (iron-dependent ADH family)